MIACLICDKIFKPTHKTTRYCSKRCQHESMRGKKRSPESIAKSKEFYAKRRGVIITKEKFEHLYWEQGRSVPWIAKEIQCNRSNLYQYIRRMGFKIRTRKEAIGEGENHHCWRGGKTTSKDGYVTFSATNKKGQAEHRVIVENVLGRKLKSNEVVHHINGIRDDNRNSNLLVCTRSYHTRLHMLMNIKQGKLLFGRYYGSIKEDLFGEDK